MKSQQRDSQDPVVIGAAHDRAATVTYRTPSGLVVERTCERVESNGGRARLRQLSLALDHRRGLLLACSFEYPGRYRRRELGFCDPPLVLESRGPNFALRALNVRGELLLEALLPVLCDAPDLRLDQPESACLSGNFVASEGCLREEDRTLSPSIMSVVRALRSALYQPSEPLLGLYGALGYDLVFQFETLRQSRTRTDARELVMYLPDEIYLHDPATGTTDRHGYEFRLGERSTHTLTRNGSESRFVGRHTSTCASDHSPGQFVAGVELAKQAFARGDLFEVTLSQTFRRPFTGRPSLLFESLSTKNPAPYGFFANLGQGELLIGASPEMYVRVSGSRVETCPIAGTIARGADALEDAQQIRRLLESDKDEAELTMCTDVDRNDKARICVPGSVRVIGRRQIELYSRLIHTVDHVEGQLREGYDGIDALLTHMWAVTVTGAPKLDAMQFIEDHELAPRGFYAGAVGAIGFDGSIDTGLTLRTIHLRDGSAEVRAGATLLHDSDPESEQRESELKASALLAVLEDAERATTERTAPRASLRITRAPLPVLLIDHRDSFVHTLADYFRQADCQVTTLRHGFDERLYEQLRPALVVLSPGPKRPDDFTMRETLGQLARRALPVFGVCLGLQGMVEFVGGTLSQLTTPVHGKFSEVSVREGSPLFTDLPARFSVGRYHSLHAERMSLPSELSVLAETMTDGCIMAIGHRTLPWHAVQFHPESILTSERGQGQRLIGNVARLARARG